jgi:type IV pilus assembly protein PilB
MQVDGKQLGDFLLDGRLLSREQLGDILARAEAQGEDAYMALVQSAAVPQDELRRAAAHVLGVPFIQLDHDDIAPEALMLIPEPIARNNSLIAFKRADNMVEVVLLDLDDLPAIQFLSDQHHLKILPRLTDRDSIKRALLLYQKILKEKFATMLQHGEAAVDALIQHAILSRAGGIHLDLSTTGMLVRYRINHVLHEAMQLPEQIGKSLALRLKSLAKILPVSSGTQEGRFKVEKDGEKLTVHLSYAPTAEGEKLHLRLAREKLGQHGFTLELLGFHGEALECMHDALRQRSGIILVSGPQEGGKTTLLYTLLDILSSPHLAITTVEDTVGQRLPHVTQMRVVPESGISFASTVRSALKQDVDVLMLGDVRDKETAMLANSAASRGVLVLLGIESSSAAQAIEDFASLGISPLQLTSTLLVSVHTRIVKKVCPQFREEHHLSRPEGAPLEGRANFGRVLAALKDEKVITQGQQWKDLLFFTAESCKECEGGYVGQTGLQEVLPTTSSIKELLLRRAPLEEVEEAARQTGMLTVMEDGLCKAAQGITSIEELLLLTQA